MTSDRANFQSPPPDTEKESPFADTYYGVLGLYPGASPIEVRRAYRELSKRYHPDTTELPAEIATVRFQKINEAYATLGNPDRRSLYDLKIGYSRWHVIQTIPDLDEPVHERQTYVDPTDRPLSSGEIFALFILALTIIACLLSVAIVAIVRGDNSLSFSCLTKLFIENFG